MQNAGDVSASQAEVGMVAADEALCAAARTTLKAARTASPVQACARVADAGSWKTTAELRRDVVPPDGDGDGDVVRDGENDREAALLGETDGDAVADEETDLPVDGEAEHDDVIDIRRVPENGAEDLDLVGDTVTECCTDDVGVTEGAGVGETAKPPANVSTMPVAPEIAIRRMTLLPVSATSSALLPEMVVTPKGRANKALVPIPLA